MSPPVIDVKVLSAALGGKELWFGGRELGGGGILAAVSASDGLCDGRLGGRDAAAPCF